MTTVAKLLDYSGPNRCIYLFDERAKEAIACGRAIRVTGEEETQAIVLRKERKLENDFPDIVVR